MECIFEACFTPLYGLSFTIGLRILDRSEASYATLLDFFMSFLPLLTICVHGSG